MKRSTGPSRKTSNLSKPVDRHLHAYALAASAAGVGMLALVQPAEAKVIHKVVNATISANGSYSLDLNKIGVEDFTIFQTYGVSSLIPFDNLGVAMPNGRNAVWLKNPGSDLPVAVALDNDVVIGPGAPFGNVPGTFVHMAQGSRDIVSSWAGAKGRFLGLKFYDLAGKPHYGWARLSVTGVFPFTVELFDYAYETEEYTPITTCKSTRLPEDEDEKSELQADPATPVATAPRSASLGHLAVGAAAIDAWRAESTASK
jgi:hypothetical protein